MLLTVATLAGVVAFTARASGHADEEASPIYGVKIPRGYRDWRLISVANVGAPVNDIRAKLGNDVAMKAYRERKLPFPDGTIIARLAWQQVTSEENSNAIGRVAEKRLPPEQVKKLLDESFVAGPPSTSSSWSRIQQNMLRPAAGVSPNSTMANLATRRPTKPLFPVTSHDFVFTRYAP